MLFIAKNVSFSLFAALVAVVGPSWAAVVEEPSQALSTGNDESTIVASSTTTTSFRGLRSSTAGRFLPTCGNGNRGDGVCANGQCCSQYGWCGTTSAHCSGSSGGGTCGNGSRGNGVCANGQCCSQYGWCGTTSAHCSGSSGGGGTCGNGSRGNGVCANGQCCSQYGWCGTTSAHCSGPTAPAPAPSGGGGGGSTLSTGSGSATYYYDITGRTCNGEAPYAENNGYPTCTSYNPAYYKTLQQYGSNNIVAIDSNLLSAPGGRDKYCGKEIIVYKNGQRIAGGPYYVFDGCAACIGGGKIDFSVTAIQQIDSNACFLGVVPGVSWTITDRQIVPFVA